MFDFNILGVIAKLDDYSFDLTNDTCEGVV